MEPPWAGMKMTPETWPNMAAGALLLAMLAGLALPACKQSADASKTVKEPPRASQESTAQGRGEDALVQQAASSCRQRIQQAAQEHAANAKRMQEANVLAMKEVTQREQLEAKRELVRKFLASNEGSKEYDQVQFSPPGALKKYNDFLAAIEAALKEQKELQEQ